MAEIQAGKTIYIDGIWLSFYVSIKGGFMQLTVKVTERSPGEFVFKPAGGINSATSSILEKHVLYILKGSPKSVIFDLQDTSYISSAGVRIVFMVHKEMNKSGGQFYMTNMQPQIKKVFEIVNALPSMQVFTSIEELDRYLDLMQKKELAKED